MPHHQGISALLGSCAPGLGCSSAKHRQIRSSNFSFPCWLCDFCGKNSFNSCVSVAGLMCLCQFLISAFLKHATVNIVCQDIIFVLCKCVYLYLLRNLYCFVPSLCPLCAYPLLFLSFCSQFSRARSFGFFHLLVEINNLGPRSVSWDRPVGKHLSRDFLFTIPTKRSLGFLNPFNMCCVNFVLVN